MDALLDEARTPTDGRIVTVQQALRAGATVQQVYAATGIDPWFLEEIAALNDAATDIGAAEQLDADVLRWAKELGFSDAQVGTPIGGRGGASPLSLGQPAAMYSPPL